jgi:predicted TIM-barrel fold metal-dependent hydrolase
MDAVVVSADSHVLEPFDLWQKPLGAKYGDRVPRVVKSFEGRPGTYFYCGKEACVLEEMVSVDAANQERVDELLRAGEDPASREKCMDRDGVAAEVIHATWTLYTMRAGDPQLVRDCCHIFNDWLAEYCQHNPKRLVGIAMIPIDDVGWGVRELERVAKRGLRGAVIHTRNPEGTPPYRDPSYDPFWAASQAMNMPVTLHIITGRARDPYTLHGEERSEAPRCSVDIWTEVWPVLSTEFIFGGIFDRFPRLKIVLGEYEVAWVPYFRFRAERAARLFTTSFGLRKPDRAPGDYLRENIYFGMIDDPLAVRSVDEIGVDRILWGSDFPHPPCTYPNTHATLDRILAGLPAETQRKIVGGNVMQVYGMQASDLRSP